MKSKKKTWCYISNENAISNLMVSDLFIKVKAYTPLNQKSEEKYSRKHYHSKLNYRDTSWKLLFF